MRKKSRNFVQSGNSRKKADGKTESRKGIPFVAREDMIDGIENFEGGNLECLASSFGEWWKEVDEEGRNLLTSNCVPDLVVWRRWGGCEEWKEDCCKRMMTLLGCKCG